MNTRHSIVPVIDLPPRIRWHIWLICLWSTNQSSNIIERNMGPTWEARRQFLFIWTELWSWSVQTGNYLLRCHLRFLTVSIIIRLVGYWANVTEEGIKYHALKNSNTITVDTKAAASHNLNKYWFMNVIMIMTSFCYVPYSLRLSIIPLIKPNKTGSMW